MKENLKMTNMTNMVSLFFMFFNKIFIRFKGKYFFPDGTRYEGEFKNSEING